MAVLNLKLLVELFERLSIVDEPLTHIYLHPSEAAHYGLKEGDRAEQFQGLPVVKIVRPLPEVTSPGQIINRARRRK